jgi:ankyrin repeat protein
LIKLGAKVDYAGPTNITPIMWASKRGHDKLILKLMNEYKANSELTTDYG